MYVSIFFRLIYAFIITVPKDFGLTKKSVSVLLKNNTDCESYKLKPGFYAYNVVYKQLIT